MALHQMEDELRNEVNMPEVKIFDTWCYSQNVTSGLYKSLELRRTHKEKSYKICYHRCKCKKGVDIRLKGITYNYFKRWLSVRNPGDNRYKLPLPLASRKILSKKMLVTINIPLKWNTTRHFINKYLRQLPGESIRTPW